MSTELKIETNRANAQFSTGPRTEEGKARSSQNARKHGLTAQQSIVNPEEQEEFEELLAHYQKDIQPQGAIQQTLFDELVTASWNLRRVRILQSQTDMRDPLSERLARHHTRFERTYQRALKELKALQTDARLHDMLPRHDRQRTPFLASPIAIAKRSQQRERERQFDSPLPPLQPASAQSASGTT
jgi:hypothetical protein